MRSKIEQGIEDVFGRDLLALPEKQLQIELDNALCYWRTKGFPYEKMTSEDIFKEYKKIERTDCNSILIGNKIISSTVGLGLANSFHPQMWHIARRDHLDSPIQHFENDETLRKVLLRAIRFWPNRHCWRAYNVRNVFRIYSGGRVSNFRPTVSKALIEKFSCDNARVLDFCSGFGGRLLGAASLKRHYTGIDPSPKQIAGIKKMYKSIQPFARGSAEFYKGCAEDLMPTMDARSFDLIFTSPPYFWQEKYCLKRNQSYLRYQSYPEWRDKFLEPVIRESHRLLKRGGFLVINISDVKNYDLTGDLEEFAAPYFKLADKYSLDLNARPVQRKNGLAYKCEPVYIFKK